MPAKKPAAAKKIVSEKSKAEAPAPPKFDVEAEITGIIERLGKLETTVDAIRREYKGKGVPMP